MIIFSNYSWYELWGPICLVVTVLMTYLYYKKSLLQIFIEFQMNKLNVFCRGLAFYIVKGSPLTVIADHYLLSAHIFQLAMFLLVFCHSSY
ncbi:hypothetical protein ACI2OX_07305 [Bacillus sp. N9]